MHAKPDSCVLYSMVTGSGSVLADVIPLTAFGKAMARTKEHFQFRLRSMFFIVASISVPLAVLRISLFGGLLAIVCSTMMLVTYFSRSTFGQDGWYHDWFLNITSGCLLVVFGFFLFLALSVTYFPSSRRVAFEAVEANNIDRLKSVISRVDVDSTKMGSNIQDELTLLSVAVVKSNPAIIALLLDKGAAPNHQGAHMDMTPLHRIAHHQFGNPDAVEIIKLLIENGADPTMPDATGRTPIDYAYNAPIEILNALQWKPDRDTE